MTDMELSETMDDPSRSKNLPEKLLTLEQVAEYLNVDKFTIYRLLAEKGLPAFKVGNQWRFKRRLLENWLQKTFQCPQKRFLANLLAESTGRKNLALLRFPTSRFHIVTVRIQNERAVIAGAILRPRPRLAVVSASAVTQ